MAEDWPRIVIAHRSAILPKCDPLELASHDWQPFGQTLLKCARDGCGIVTTRALFDLPEAHLP